MAIDSKEKRASVVGINRVAGPSPIPTAAKDQEWRQEVGYGYSGIAAGAPPAVTAATNRGLLLGVYGSRPQI